MLGCRKLLRNVRIAYLSSFNGDEFFSVNFTADAICDGFCDILNIAVEQFIPVKFTVQKSTKKLTVSLS